MEGIGYGDPRAGDPREALRPTQVHLVCAVRLVRGLMRYGAAEPGRGEREATYPSPAEKENTMSWNEIYNILRAAGLKYHSKSWEQYEYAKKLLLSEPLSQLEYSRRLTAITDYLGI